MGFKVKTKRLAQFVADPIRLNSTPRKITPICNPPLYIAVTFEPSMQFKNPFWFGNFQFFLF